MRTVCLLLFLLFSTNAMSQTAAYDSLVFFAEQDYLKGNYQQAADNYSKAFIELGGKGLPTDRYHAAKCWALVHQPDSAFFNLFRLAEKTDYLDFQKVKDDEELKNLHRDNRWIKLLSRLNPTNESYNDSLASVLEKIYESDQSIRSEMRKLREKYNTGSPEYKELARRIQVTDSINLILVTSLIDQFGWLSKAVVGKTGNSAVWLVIQHADLATQEKYYPIMEKAVQENKASRKDLAYLEDRILMRQGKKQLYGTQYKLDSETNEMKLWEVEDPDRLNERRASVGLPPM
jgi:hypothetical protein